MDSRLLQIRIDSVLQAKVLKEVLLACGDVVRKLRIILRYGGK